MNTTAAQPGARALRADARRNRERILEAAHGRFSAEGLDAQIDDIAKDAGVGVGTVYRHFPTKEDLVAALADRRFAILADLARECIAREDAWQAFCDYMRRSAEMQAGDLALAEAMASMPDMMTAAAMRAGMDELMTELVDRAKEAGALRPDAEWQDVPMMICGLGRIVQAAGNDGHFMAWDRLLGILLDGMRAPGSTPLPER